MIACRGLTRRFGEFTAVDGLDLDVPAGTVCAFLGPNGAGKSTTVKMMTGLLAPTSGEVQVCGVDVARQPEAVKQRIGVLPEDLGLFDDLTVWEHLQLSGDIYGLSGAVTRERAGQLLRAFSLAHGRDTGASHCSHGMRKKTSLAMALLHNPEVLFLDEPFEAIDPVTAQTIRDLLMRIAGRGITVFLTSHILSLVERVASQVIIVRQGKVVRDEQVAGLSRPLEELYFDVAERPVMEELPWLGSRRS
ncbi:MAG: ABC transporter ATP-binding protein [Acidobacteria bacterium]|nr:ABC transporter ATP-binding protein [Acidobacteriota bacterium]